MADRWSQAEGARIVAAARGWIGTPYQHQASCRGAGADCLGLVRGVWRELIGPEPEVVPPYSASWTETAADDPLAAAAARLFVPVAEAALGDVLLFRLGRGGPAKHLAILASDTVRAGRIVHAYSGHTVCETAVPPGWVGRLAGIFRFPIGGA